MKSTENTGKTEEANVLDKGAYKNFHCVNELYFRNQILLVPGGIQPVFRTFRAWK